MSLLLLSSTAYGQDTIRVLLGQEKILSFQTSYPGEMGNGTTQYSLGTPATFKVEKQNKQWNVQAVFVGGRSKSYSIPGPTLIFNSSEIHWKKQHLRHPLVLLSQGQTINVVAHMPVDEYLKGVIPHEMPPLWPAETLKAQVVASRTYALWKAQSQKNEAYDVQATVMDQVFRLPASGQKKSASEDRVDDAIAATHNQVLATSNNKMLKAYFHADCGGSTESAKSIWGTSYIDTSAAKDKSCQQRKENEWSSQWGPDKLSHRLKSEFYLPSSLELVDVIVRSRFASQRVESVDVLFSKGIFKRLRGEDVRRILGYDKIKSTLFDLRRVSGQWVFSGKGHGHGVGMCQWGARSMAKSGKTYKEILAHYYPQAHLMIQKESSTRTNSLSQNESETYSF